MLKHLNLNGKYIYYEEEGKGTPILFIHPPGVGRKIFRYQITYLKHKYRVIALDISGSGDSRTCSSSPSIKERAEEIALFIDGLGIENVHLASFSGGCAIAQTLALRYPNKIRSLTMIEGFARIQSRLQTFMYRSGIKALQETEDLVIKLISNHLTSDLQLRDTLRNHMRKSDVNVWVSDYQKLLHYNPASKLKNITAPVLLIQGGKSKFSGRSGLTEYLPSCKTAICKEHGHNILTKGWEKVNSELLQFIKKDSRDK